MNLLPLLAGLVSMRAAFDRGDLDEAARQGALAGPVIVGQALASPERATQLAGIAAATEVEDRAELLPALAKLAAGPDRRTAIPAARAARDIAHRLARLVPDDLSGVDFSAAWAALALRRDRWIEVRVLALDVAGSLADPGTLGFDLAAILAEPDGAVRLAAVALVPQPAPVDTRAHLATAVIHDTDDRVAIGAAQALCADLVGDPPAPILAALGAAGLVRLRALVTMDKLPIAAIRDAARCLAADPESAATLKAIAPKLPPAEHPRKPRAE